MANMLKSGGPRFGLHLFLLGLVFEFFVLVLHFMPGLTSNIPFLLRFQNAILAVHWPMICLLGILGDSSAAMALIALPFAIGLMALFWAATFYGILRLKYWLSTRVFVSPRRRLVAQRAAVWSVILMLTGAVFYALPQTPRSFKGSPGTSAVIDANTAFAVDLYQKLRTQPGNLFFSPYSISSALAMTYAGARGQTESEMAKVLHFDPGQTNVHSDFRTLTDRINDLQRFNRIKIVAANSLWYQHDYRFLDAFMNLVQQDYHAEARPVDFEKEPGAAANDIDSWVDRKTEGKIPNIIGEGGFDSSTRLVLCNAIYFKGKWQTQFSPSDTRPAPFYVSSNETETVPMMSVKGRFKMADSDDRTFRLLEMPYVGNDLSMVILLPGNSFALGDGNQPTLSDIEEKLTPQKFQACLANLDRAGSAELNLSIPRFTTTQSFDLSGQLKSLGMKVAFDPGTADFSGMDGTTNLYVSNVFHKAFVQVDEEGTEAAAATAVSVVAADVALSFTANHPFIFLIRDNGSGAILFLGRIVDPTK